MCLTQAERYSRGRLGWYAYGRRNRLSERDIRGIAIAEWAGKLTKPLDSGVGVAMVIVKQKAGSATPTYTEQLATTRHLFFLSNALASSCAEICSCAVLTPAEVIKQNAQVLTQGPGSISTTGYGALVARNLPHTALQFPMFEMLKAKLCPVGSSVQEMVVWAGIAAGSSGSVAAVLTTPIDVVKTRIMLAAGEKKTKRKGVKMVVKDVLRDEGFRGLWRGGALRGVWTFLGSGLFLGIYEGSKVWLERRRGETKEEIL
ncbi:mitochondrial carrier domain-containing protein [Trichophaea hybrida]|nr:mitochondrial carrier domain-containing protein [Trichophaea hybrida]